MLCAQVSFRYVGWLTLLLLAVLAAVTGMIACDPGHTVTFENQTSQNITIFRDGHSDFELKPFETASFTFLEFSNDILLEGKNEDGQTIYAETVTWMDLERSGWRITITDSSSR